MNCSIFLGFDGIDCSLKVLLVSQCRLDYVCIEMHAHVSLNENIAMSPVMGCSTERPQPDAESNFLVFRTNLLLSVRIKVFPETAKVLAGLDRFPVP